MRFRLFCPRRHPNPARPKRPVLPCRRLLSPFRAMAGDGCIITWSGGPGLKSENHAPMPAGRHRSYRFRMTRLQPPRPAPLPECRRDSSRAHGSAPAAVPQNSPFAPKEGNGRLHRSSQTSLPAAEGTSLWRYRWLPCPRRHRQRRASIRCQAPETPASAPPAGLVRPCTAGAQAGDQSRCAAAWYRLSAFEAGLSLLPVKLSAEVAVGPETDSGILP